MKLKRKLIYFHLKAKYNETYPVVFMLWSFVSLFFFIFSYPFICVVHPLALVFLPIAILIIFSGIVTIRDYDFETAIRAKYQIRNVDFFREYDNAVIKIQNLKKQIKILKRIKHIDIL